MLCQRQYFVGVIQYLGQTVVTLVVGCLDNLLFVYHKQVSAWCQGILQSEASLPGIDDTLLDLGVVDIVSSSH